MLQDYIKEYMTENPFTFEVNKEKKYMKLTREATTKESDDQMVIKIKFFNIPKDDEDE